MTPHAWISPDGALLLNEIYEPMAQQFPEKAAGFVPLHNPKQIADLIEHRSRETYGVLMQEHAEVAAWVRELAA